MKNSRDPLNLNTYSLKLLSVKMKVKFQCKMKIEHNSISLTSEISSQQGSIYSFNQSIVLIQKQITESFFLLTVCLVTSKGAKYTSGLAHLYFSQLERAARSGNHKIVLMLDKCLDSEASMEIYVDSISKSIGRGVQNEEEGLTRRNRLHGNNNEIQRISQRRVIQNSPPLSPKEPSRYAGHAATRSQIFYSKPKQIRFQQNVSQKTDRNNSRSKYHHISKQRQKTLIDSEAGQRNTFGMLPLTSRQMYRSDIHQLKSEIGEEFGQSYARLKSKLKKQEIQSQKDHERLMNVEKNEAKMKIEVLKYHLKCDDLEKNIIDKNGNIKKLEIRVEELERHLQNDFIQPVIVSRSQNESSSLYQQTKRTHKRFQNQYNESAIISLESKVNFANKQLQELRNKMSKINKAHSEKQSSLLKELQSKKIRIMKLEQQVIILNGKRTNRNSQKNEIELQQKNKYILELQKQKQIIQIKSKEIEIKNISLQKENEGFKQKIQQITKNLNLLSLQKTKFLDQIQSQKQIVQTIQYRNNTINKNIHKLEQELKELTKYKQKYNDTVIDIKRIEGERILENKNNDLLLKNAQKNIINLQNKSKQDLQNMNKRNTELQAKSRQQTIKIRDLEDQAKNIQYQLQSLKKTNQRLQKECDQHKSNERNVKKQLLSVQSKSSQSGSESQMWKNKFKSLQNIYKLESDKYINEITRMKETLQKEMINQMSIKQKHASVSSELAILTNKFNILDEKYARQTKQLSQKLQTEINRNKLLEQNIQNYAHINTQGREKEKQLLNKIEEYGENQTEYSRLIKSYEQQLTKVKGVLAITQNKLETKVQQLTSTSKSLTQITEKYNIEFHKSKQQTYELKNKANELERNLKQNEKLQHEISLLKNNLDNRQKQLQKQKIALQQETTNKNEIRQQFEKVSMEIQNLSKDGDRFKDHLHDVVIRELSGADGLQAFAMCQIRNRGNNITLKDLLSKNGIEIGIRGSKGELSSSQNYDKVSQQTKMTKFQKIHESSHNFESNYNLIHSSSGPSINSRDIISIVNQFAKQSKIIITKLIEQYRNLQKDFDEMKYQGQQKQNQILLENANFEENIKNLQEQLQLIIREKQNQHKKSLTLASEYENKIKQYETDIQSKRQQIDQYIFTVNGLKMQLESDRQFYDHKNTESSMRIKQLSSELCMITEKCQKQHSKYIEFKQKTQILQTNLTLSKQQCEIKENKIKQFDNEIKRLQQIYQESHNKNKILLTQISQMEIILTNQKQSNGKNILLISQEQKKLHENQDFINSLIKQKQAIVRLEIENGQKIVELQTIKLNLQSELQHLTTKLDYKIKEFTAEKQTNKKVCNRNKQLQSQLTSVKENLKKVQQLLAIKQKEFLAVTSTLQIKEVSFEKEINHKNKLYNEESQQKNLQNRIKDQQIKNLKKELDLYESETIPQLKQQLKILGHALQNAHTQLDSLQRSLQERQYELNSAKQLRQRINVSRQKQEESIKSLMDELREKDEQLFDISGQLYALDQKYHQALLNYKWEIEKKEEQFEYKCDGLSEDYQTKIDELEKERDYYKHKVIVAEQDLKKMGESIQNKQFQDVQQKIASKDKISRIEQQKIHSVNTLKLQLARANEQKQKQQSINQKLQIDLDKIKVNEQNSKTTIQKLEIKIKQIQSKFAESQTQCFTKTQNEKKRQIVMKTYQESVQNYQWMLQREVKKQMQNLIKNVINLNLGADCAQPKRKITENIKQIENRISKIVGGKL